MNDGGLTNPWFSVRQIARGYWHTGKTCRASGVPHRPRRPSERASCASSSAVVLDQKRLQGQVWVKILWQTGATSEHSVQRRVHTYGDYIDIDKLRARVTELNAVGKMDKEIASVLNAEGFLAAQNCAFKGDNVWLLRRRWGIPTVKINGTSSNPARWPDGTYSFKVPQQLWASHLRSSSIISPADGSRDTNSPRASRGKST
ncbi:hypothetical protein QO004_002832 [Rhizobium mesoamericanum]|uniref:hypothetical protein n=1 Tax=Rhizobium mesoamericanum TaxID=1079800 RepID=UPI00277E7589|nr:hypothetical protein [Rhizobium mesoamericanum]MDQ0561039.1 hypothetical protein [Rhizobium mesoamericanum]